MAEPTPKPKDAKAGKNWWAKLDPKQRRLVIGVAAVLVFAILYLAMRSRGGSPTGALEKSEKEGQRENVYPTAEQFGYPGGAEASGSMVEGPEGVPGVEGLEGAEGREGPEGPPSTEPGPPGPPGPHKNAHKRKAGGKATGGGHAGTTKRHKNRSGGTGAHAAHKGVHHERKKKQHQKRHPAQHHRRRKH